MKTKKVVLGVSLVLILACGVYVSVVMGQSDPTYDGTGTDVVGLMENPENFDNSNPDGIA